MLACASNLMLFRVRGNMQHLSIVVYLYLLAQAGGAAESIMPHPFEYTSVVN